MVVEKDYENDGVLGDSLKLNKNLINTRLSWLFGLIKFYVI